MSAYIKSYGSRTKWMYSLIEDDELLETHDDTWNKVSNSIKIEFEPIYKKSF